MKRYAAIATILVLVHLAIVYVHGEAHESLGVDLLPWQWAFSYSVIVTAPLVAMLLVWSPWPAAGALLLGVSMVGSFAFGVNCHFMTVSPDHVSHLPTGDAQSTFVVTAYLMAILEAATAAFGFWSFAMLRRRAE
jgi:hypothetical protein